METEKNAVKSAKTAKIYSANELCNIIKTCNKYEVTNLKIGGIEIDFKVQGTETAQAGMPWPTQKAAPKRKGDTAPLKPLELTDKDREELEELERDQLALDDPLAYEAGIIKDFMDGEANEEANGYS